MPRSDPVSPAMAQSRDPKKDDCSKEEMAVATDATALVDEPESMVNPGFIKNDSYEKGPDSLVVLVYLKEICRDISAVSSASRTWHLLVHTLICIKQICKPEYIFSL